MDRYQFSESERSVLEKSLVPFGFFQLIDRRIVTLILSDGFINLFGYENREYATCDMDHDMYRNTHSDDVSRIREAAYSFITENAEYDTLYRTKPDCGGEYMIIHAVGKRLYMEDGSCIFQVGYTSEGIYRADEEPSLSNPAREILNHEIVKERNLMAGHYDYLTGLSSMTFFFELARVGIRVIEKSGFQPVIIFMDLSGLKYFNHWHGFEEGDKLLRSFASALAEDFGADNCSRFGQDHFVLFTEKEGLEKKLLSLFRKFGQMNDGKTLPIRAGIYDGPLEDIDISTACDLAKIACDQMRDTYVSGYNYFSSILQSSMERQRYVITHLDQALEEGWITVFYQPIVRAVNGRVCDEEALARWIDPVMGFLSPGDFIPALEEAELIYKLDLYVLDQVLEKIKKQEEAGLHIVPQSVNLSRSDFSACDIVEEIRKRVDEASVSRRFITIEITESIIGSDFEFMKKQVERFRDLGFQVWMDDFGSGYSSLDVLQSLHFDLIKFDMRFMQQFNSGVNNRIILTELMKLATSLGMDTVCEGVETKEQLSFLQEIGCCKLQGYYFLKPVSFEEILSRYRSGKQIGFENPEESGYYDSIGRVNLYDLDVMSHDDESAFHNYFNALPMALIEVKGEDMRYIRCNQSYQDFSMRVFGFRVGERSEHFGGPDLTLGKAFMAAILDCCLSGRRSFVEERVADGSMVRSFIRRIAVNPVTNVTAIAIAVLSVLGKNEGTTYENIARALAANYFNIFYVNLKTDEFIEYSSVVGEEGMSRERHGGKFFEAARMDARTVIHKDDRERFIAEFTKEKMISRLDSEKVFSINYRMMRGDELVYANMKAVRMQYDPDSIIIGVSNVDSIMRQQESMERLKQERAIYSRIRALSGDFLALYLIDPCSSSYTEFSAMDEYTSLGLEKSGKDFFAFSMEKGEGLIYDEDLQRYRENFTKEKMIKAIEQDGIYLFYYRLMIDKKAWPVCARAVMVDETDGRKLIVGVYRDHLNDGSGSVSAQSREMILSQERSGL